MTDRKLLERALEALEGLADTSWTAAFKQREYDSDEPNENVERERVLVTIAALRERLAQPEQEPVDSAEKAGAYMDARLWEFIDMAAAWPEAKPDPRTWGHVMVYAPKRPEQEPEPVAWVIWCHGPAGIFDHKQFAELELERRNKAYPAPERKLLPLYTTPPRREWVGLTLEEIGLLTTGDGWSHLETPALALFARAIEAKLKEKNA